MIFLGPLNETDLPLIRSLNPLSRNNEEYWCSSGTKAIQLLLKSFSNDGEKKLVVGFPAFICSDVQYAIEQEGHIPLYLDIELQHFFLDENEVFKKKMDVLILPHIYGVLHPKTKEVINHCEKHGIYLIHDAAQSYGLQFNGVPIEQCSDGGVISFGAGKSLTAASGAIVYGVTQDVFNQYKLDEIKKYCFYSNQFLKERMALPAFKWVHYLKPKRFQIAEIQKKAGIYAINKFGIIEKKRRENWAALSRILPKDLYANHFTRSSFYKYVFYCEGDFIPPKELNQVPIRINKKKIETVEKLINYNQMSGTFVEVSTERSVNEFNLIFNLK
jgi:dTDP-4-amino-4,6-dideoxygalactose transaminase